MKKTILAAALVAISLVTTAQARLPITGSQASMFCKGSEDYVGGRFNLVSFTISRSLNKEIVTSLYGALKITEINGGILWLDKDSGSYIQEQDVLQFNYFGTEVFAECRPLGQKAY